MGLPMNRHTSDRNFGRNLPTGMASCPPSMAIGTIGTPTCMARAAAPAFGWPILPLRERVPSGKTRIGTPARSRRPVIPAALLCSTLSRLPLRRIG